MPNIPELQEKLKGFLRSDLYVVVLVLVVGFGGFGLGKLSSIEAKRPPVRIEYPAQGAGEVASTSGRSTSAAAQAAAVTIATDPNPTPAPVSEPAQTTTGTYVASKSGTRYYLPACSSAKRIAAANKVWFNTKQEAEAAGYTPAVNCKGL